MANRWMTQFIKTFLKEHKKILLEAVLQQAVKATKVTQGITLTAVLFGTSGNSITIAFTGGGTAGAEVVTVSGNAISVQIQSGVSTVTQVRTAINASGAAAALVAATGTSSSTVSTASAVSLTGGIDGVASFYGPGIASCVRSGVGEYTLVFQDKYVKFMGARFQLLAATAVDLVPQIKSFTASTKTLVLNLNAGATPTEVAAAATLYMEADFRDSTVTT